MFSEELVPGHCECRQCGPFGHKPRKKAEQWILPAAGSIQASGSRSTHRGLGLARASSHPKTRSRRLVQPPMAVAHSARAAVGGGGWGHEPSLFPHSTAKKRMCSGRAQCGGGCAVAAANSAQTSCNSGHRATVSRSQAFQQRSGLTGSASAALTCCRLMVGGDGMIPRVRWVLDRAGAVVWLEQGHECDTE